MKDIDYAQVFIGILILIIVAFVVGFMLGEKNTIKQISQGKSIIVTNISTSLSLEPVTKEK